MDWNGMILAFGFGTVGWLRVLWAWVNVIGVIQYFWIVGLFIKEYQWRVYIHGLLEIVFRWTGSSHNCRWKCLHPLTWSGFQQGMNLELTPSCASWAHEQVW